MRRCFRWTRRRTVTAEADPPTRVYSCERCGKDWREEGMTGRKATVCPTCDPAKARVRSRSREMHRRRREAEARFADVEAEARDLRRQLEAALREKERLAARVDIARMDAQRRSPAVGRSRKTTLVDRIMDAAGHVQDPGKLSLRRAVTSLAMAEGRDATEDALVRLGGETLAWAVRLEK